MQAPSLIKKIPAQSVNERAAYGPFDLKEYIQAPDGSKLTFQAEVVGGRSLPQGLICTADGILTGIPAQDTQGNYEFEIEASNASGGKMHAKFSFSILPNLANKNKKLYIDELKQQIWQALGQNLAAPEITALLDRAVTPLDVYHLLERWGTLTIYDAFNLEPPGEKHLLALEGASEHFFTYDRGCCLVACPKDLFSHERTVADGLRTCEALAREAYKRGWTVELIGFDKYARAAWVEIQHLNENNARKMEVLNYNPSTFEMHLVQMQSREKSAEKRMDQ